jgi:protocatechuate 3,4-dioxygenase beta subunit
MKTENKLDRRQWLKISMGTILGGISTKIFGREATSGECRTTPYQTMGPFHPNKDQADKDFDLTLFNGSDRRAEGELIYVRGRVTDENCDPIKGAVVMIWQANKYGKYSHEYDTREAKDDPNFQGWGQVVTNEKGEYGFKTIKPGAYPVDAENNVWRTPHIHFKVSKRGYHELITQMYFDGEELNKHDILLPALSDTEKEQVIRKAANGAAEIDEGASLFQFDLVLKSVQRQGKYGSDIDQFVGKYSVNIKVPELEQELVQFYGGKRDRLILTITKENGVLFAEMPIQPQSEIFSKSRDRYDYRAFEADIEFQRDRENAVTGLIFHRHYDFPKLSAEKIK